MKSVDRRLNVLFVTFVTILALGAAINAYQGSISSKFNEKTGELTSSSEMTKFAEHARDKRREEIDDLFQKAVIMLHSKQYDYAIVALHRVLELAPQMPEAHVNMGFALLGLDQNKAALDFFEAAVALRPDQANAYYGMAVALEGSCDLLTAISAMRTYVHLAAAGDQYVRKGRAALWEWESSLVARNSRGIDSDPEPAGRGSGGTLEDCDAVDASKQQ